MMRIINPESFEFDGDDLQSLRDICRLATELNKGMRLAGMLDQNYERAMALANKILSVPIYFVQHEE